MTDGGVLGPRPLFGMWRLRVISSKREFMRLMNKRVTLHRSLSIRWKSVF